MRVRSHVIMLLCGSAWLTTGCGDHPAATRQAGPDLTIQYIHRTPEMDYVWNSQNPTRDGWPVAGQRVVWQAFVKNWAAEQRTVGCSWTLDGGVTTACSLTIPAGGVATADFPWSWEFARHTLTFTVDPANEIAEEEEGNNSLSVITDALSVGLYVERGFYDYFRTYQHNLAGVHSTSFEDWAQRQVARMNTMFSQAIYTETPNGVLDRWRLDKITIVADGALPLTPTTVDTDFELNQAVANVADRSVDLQWGFPVSQLPAYSNTRSVTDENEFYFSGFLQHELGHARYLIDVYGFNVVHFTPDLGVAVRENNVLIAGTSLLPGTSTIMNGAPGLTLHLTMPGLMNSQWTFVDRYSAMALNLIAGRRATRGNYNSPENRGIFLNDLPAQNRVRFTDLSGAAIVDASVQVFRAGPTLTEPAFFWPYRKYFDNVADMTVRTDAQGMVDLGRNPFAGDAPIVMGPRPSWYTNGVILLRVETPTNVGYQFLESSTFNMAYWRGDTALATYDVKVPLSFK